MKDLRAGDSEKNKELIANHKKEMEELTNKNEMKVKFKDQEIAKIKQEMKEVENERLKKVQEIGNLQDQVHKLEKTQQEMTKKIEELTKQAGQSADLAE